MRPAALCPLCSGSLTLVQGAVEEQVALGGVLYRGRPIPTRLRLARFLACNACEFCTETTPAKEKS